MWLGFWGFGIGFRVLGSLVMILGILGLGGWGLDWGNPKEAKPQNPGPHNRKSDFWGQDVLFTPSRQTASLKGRGADATLPFRVVFVGERALREPRDPKSHFFCYIEVPPFTNILCNQKIFQ